MDPFAQSRGEDDLFSDEFEPISEPATIEQAITTPPLSQPSKIEEPAPAPVPASATQQQNTPPKQSERRRDGQDRRPRGGGRGRGGSAQNGLGSSKYAPQAQAEPNPAPAPAPSAPEQDKSSSPTGAAVTKQASASSPVKPVPSQPSNVEPARIPAVRGDRSATGGPLHKKLTEEELTAKMEKMAILNAQKSERHRLSEADQAAFQRREKELAKERKEKAVAERKIEREMEMERAKNRERKMKAQGGREWDSEKTDADIVDRKGRSSDYVRGGHGGVIRGGLGASRYSTATPEDTEDTGTPRRGGAFEIRGRGGRGGRGGGRGGKGQIQQTGSKPQQAVPKPEDFPALGVASPKAPTGDWADEMATPVEEKKMDV